MAEAIDIVVRGYHVDVFGHVNNARYLEFLEEARWALFDERRGIEALLQKGFAFNVVNINISYRRAARLNDRLRVRTRLHSMGRRSATLQQTVVDKQSDALVADAQVTFVLLDLQRRKAAPLEGELKQRLMAAMGL